MAKSAKDSNGKNFNGNFVIWDLCVLENANLTSFSHEARKQILDDLYAMGDHTEPFLLATDHPNVQVVRHYYSDFAKLYDSFVPVDMLEGVVVKKRKSLLPLGLSEDSCNRSMFKFRKPTENYHY